MRKYDIRMESARRKWDCEGNASFRRSSPTSFRTSFKTRFAVHKTLANPDLKTSRYETGFLVPTCHSVIRHYPKS